MFCTWMNQKTHVCIFWFIESKNAYMHCNSGWQAIGARLFGIPYTDEKFKLLKQVSEKHERENITGLGQFVIAFCGGQVM
jgi:hypothetical protein